MRPLSEYETRSAPTSAICEKPLLAKRLRSILNPSSSSELSVQDSPIWLADRADATSPDGAAGGPGGSGHVVAEATSEYGEAPFLFTA